MGTQHRTTALVDPSFDTAMDYLADLYQRAWDQRDKRLDGYLLVDSLALNVALVSTYVFLVTVVGPRFMKDREPYNPKLLMQAYNLFQVVFCSYFVIEGGRKAWFNHYSWVASLWRLIVTLTPLGCGWLLP